MSSFSVVLDACGRYPAALRDTLLRAADAGLYRLHWSEDILDEVGRSLVKNGVADEPGVRRLLGHMRRTFPDAAVTGHECLVESMPNHPGDRHVVAAVVKANAQLIVTANLRPFSRRPL